MKKIVILMSVSLALVGCETTTEEIPSFNKSDPYLIGWAASYAIDCIAFDGYAPTFEKLHYFREKYKDNPYFKQGYETESELRLIDVEFGFNECVEAAQIINLNYAEATKGTVK